MRSLHFCQVCNIHPVWRFSIAARSASVNHGAKKRSSANRQSSQITEKKSTNACAVSKQLYGVCFSLEHYALICTTVTEEIAQGL